MIEFLMLEIWIRQREEKVFANTMHDLNTFCDLDFKMWLISWKFLLKALNMNEERTRNHISSVKNDEFIVFINNWVKKIDKHWN